MRRLSIILLSILSLAGCARNLPPILFLPSTVESSSIPITDAALGAVTVTTKSSGVEKHISADTFKVALVEILKRTNYFGDDRTKAIKIDAEIYQATFPLFGFIMKSDLGVHYIVSASGGKVLLDEYVFYQGRATIADELMGSVRALLAFQKANEGHFAILLPMLKAALSRCRGRC